MMGFKSRRWQSSSVDVRLRFTRAGHVWQIYPALPQTVQSLDDIAQFLQSHLRIATEQHNPG
jgi:hypothetical protein